MKDVRYPDQVFKKMCSFYRSAGGIANAITVEEWKVPDKMVGLSMY